MNCFFFCYTKKIFLSFYFREQIEVIFFSKYLINYNKMSCQLPADCLNEIFECLEDKATLRSCLLVNRHWCEVSVQIL